MLLTPQHRRSTRTRRAPKRYEDETFVSGAIDRYQPNYNGRFKEDSWVAKRQDAENHFVYYNNNYRNYYDFAESLLEFTSIWRDMNKELPGYIVEKIGSYLRLRDVDKQTGMLAQDDEFIAVDDRESLQMNCKQNRAPNGGFIVENSDEEEEWLSEDETDEESNWSEYSDNDISDEDNDLLEEMIYDECPIAPEGFEYNKDHYIASKSYSNFMDNEIKNFKKINKP